MTVMVVVVSVGGVGVAVEVDDGDGDWRQAARCGESESSESERVCVAERIRPGLLRLEAACLAMNGSFAPAARQVCAKARGRSGQATSSSSSLRLFHMHLPKSRPGHAVLETSVSSPPPHPPITHAIPLGHGDCNRRRTLQVGTRDVAAKICPSTALPCSTAAIPGFNPAARSTHADVSVSHGTRRGKEK